MRFNYVWSFPDKVTVGGGQNMRVPRWLTTVMVGFIIGLTFLAIPTFDIAFRTLPEQAKNSDVQSHYEYHISQSDVCQPSPVREPPVEAKTAGADSGRKSSKEK